MSVVCLQSAFELGTGARKCEASCFDIDDDFSVRIRLTLPTGTRSFSGTFFARG